MAADRGAGIALAVAVGALAHGAVLVMFRAQNTLRVYLGERVDTALSGEILTTAAGIPTIAHLEHPEYLDRLDQLRRGSWALATALWSMAAALATAVSLVLSGVLLGEIYPALAALCVLAVFPLLGSHRASRYRQAARDASAQQVRQERRLHELCVGAEHAEELRISDSARELDGRAARLWREVTRRQALAQLRGSVWELGGWLCFVAGQVGAVWLVTQQVRAGRATPGDVLLVISLATQLQWQIWAVVWNSRRVADAGHIVGHFMWLRRYARAQRSPQRRPVPQRLQRGITLDGVSFRYPGAEAPALRDIHLELPAGKTVALVGVNGSGKTTLVKLLAGMYEPTAGAVRIDGRPLAEYTLDSWRARMSGIFQDYAQFHLLARETVGVGDVARLRERSAVARAVSGADAGGVVASLPAGLDTQLGPTFDGVDVSLGQWQKLALARALMRERPLLMVLDEPSAALDAKAEHDLYESFGRRPDAGSGGVTLLVSHRFSTVRMADLIVVLDGGRLVEKGSHEALMASGGVYADLYRLQANAYADRPTTAGAAGTVPRTGDGLTPAHNG
ncbi:ABC transporter ATP-binding protein [Phytohabitans houttuyneae]|uniref:ABC transporter permease n=1 Tax=Phytohabitans houttuyneae TaxID=1076126 RepID=A0A6V8K7T5_9ACTN|nr:ABC transporter ATP-binding protein [Phytohabitans houttuyneae]GFJ78056.1 ABC transporter permease [Phytohabitans houttuyneae]